MNSWKFFLFIIFMGLGTAYAQQKLEIQGSGSSLYLNHEVSPQETFYSIGRLYNVSPRDLASFNQLQLNKGLNIGQQIKVPLDKNNFAQGEVKSVLDFYVPLYHTVKQGETLYRLGENFNKVPLTSIKKWNALSTETVSAGVPLIVGYLKVDKNQSAFAREMPETEIVGIPQQAAGQAAQEVVEERAEETPPSAQKEETVTAVPQAKNQAFRAGYFKQVFESEVVEHINIQGQAGVFKSTSGWQDGKFYCFNNEAVPGSIVKITDSESGRSIYAKVLDAIPDIKQNQGLVVILSNSAADQLGRGEEQFSCAVTYYRK